MFPSSSSSSGMTYPLSKNLFVAWLELEELDEPEEPQELQKLEEQQRVEETQVLEEPQEPEVLQELQEVLVKQTMKQFVLKLAYSVDSEVDGSERGTAVRISERQLRQESPSSPFWHFLLLLIPC